MKPGDGGFSVRCDCDGLDDSCEHCRGSGYQDVPGCPRKFVADIWPVLMFATCAERGSWPLGGGVMDQTEWIVQAVQQVWSERRYWKAVNGVTS